MSETTILQKGDVLQKEALSASATTIYPGDLLEIDSAGAVKEHATAGGNARPVLVAIENGLQGDEVSEVYTAESLVQYIAPKSGDEVLLRLATSQTIAIGDRLESASAGLVQKHTPDGDSSQYVGSGYTDPVVAIAMEAVTTTTAIDYIWAMIA
ncbi:MAG: hypothetical protein M0P71_12330 [Melioribacteraceae bacterium]|jgi:hypothetical protein|nr:hypothetical protein [Melioribacteraceae bacterium]